MAQENLQKELEQAVYEGNLEKVKASLAAGADANRRISPSNPFDQGMTLLHGTQSAEIAKELLLNGAYVNATNCYRETPLHIALTEKRKLELIKVLVEHGADVNALDRQGIPPLLRAAIHPEDTMEMFKLFLEYGADIIIKNRVTVIRRRPLSLFNFAILDLDWAKVFIKYTLLNRFDNGYKEILDLPHYKDYRNYEHLSAYMKSCEREVFQMKQKELPLYKLCKREHVLPTNLLSAKFSKIDFAERYPIYNDIILSKIKPFLERVELLNKLYEISFQINWDRIDENGKRSEIVMNYDCMYAISEYLANDDLTQFIKAFDQPKM